MLVNKVYNIVHAKYYTFCSREAGMIPQFSPLKNCSPRAIYRRIKVAVRRHKSRGNN